MAHALLSPSSATRWTRCPASVALTKDLPDESSAFAEEGTRAHRLAELMAIKTFEGVGVAVTARARTPEETDEFKTLWASAGEEMQVAALEYVGVISKVVCDAGIDSVPVDCVLLEHPVDISSLTGEPGAHGTVDCVVRAGRHLHVIDLKYGRGVAVTAQCNEQLSIYALALCEELDPFGDNPIEVIHLHIVQPRINNTHEWTCASAGFQSFKETVAKSSARALELCRDGAAPDLAKDFYPHENTCRFCKAKATCPAIHGAVVEAIATEPAISDTSVAEIVNIPVPNTPEGLSKALSVAELIEQWLDAVRAEALRQLEIGNSVPGYKLVAGRAGVRKWSDPKEAEAKLKSMKVPEALRYEKKLISPTAAQKLCKAKGDEAPVLSERQWVKLEALITRAEGKATIVVESDPRPALNMGEGFTAIEA